MLPQRHGQKLLLISLTLTFSLLNKVAFQIAALSEALLCSTGDGWYKSSASSWQKILGKGSFQIFSAVGADYLLKSMNRPMEELEVTGYDTILCSDRWSRCSSYDYQQFDQKYPGQWLNELLLYGEPS
jgi:hypothetical protein